MRTLAQMGFTQKVQRVLITPAMAIEILRDHRVLNAKQKDENNRILRNRVVQDYLYMMKHGLWTESESMILFDKNGNLINGNHRLNALALQHQSFWFTVGVDYIHDVNMDNGHNRSILDNIKLAGLTNSDLNTKNIKNTVTTLMYLKLKGRTLFPHEIINTFNYYEKELIDFSTVITGKFRACVYSALFAAYLNGVEKKDISDFLTTLKDGYTSEQNSIAPIIGLRDKLNVIKGGGAFINEDVYARTQYALHAYLDGKTSKTSKPKEYYNVSLAFLNAPGELRFI